MPEAFEDVTHAQIDPTSVCDLKCSYCVGRTWRPGHLSEPNFESFLERLPSLRYVQLQGEGEPMLGKRFWSFLERLRARDIDVGFITNGRHLSERSVARLMQAQIRTIAVSVDSMSPAAYDRLRGGDLRRVLDGVERLAAARTDATDVFLTAVLTRDSFSGFGEIRRYSDAVGLSPPSCQELQQAEAYVKAYRGLTIESDSLTNAQRAEMNAYLQERASHRVANGLVTYFESVMREDQGKSRCPFVESSIHLRYDGETFPCCFIKETQHSLGNVGSAGPGHSIPHARKLFRARLRANETPAPCRGCHVLGTRHR